MVGRPIRAGTPSELLELVIVTAEDEYKGERLAEDKGWCATAGRNWKPSVVLAAAIAAKRRAVSFMVLSDEVANGT